MNVFRHILHKSVSYEKRDIKFSLVYSVYKDEFIRISLITKQKRVWHDFSSYIVNDLL